jgi:hypothetical protein
MLGLGQSSIFSGGLHSRFCLEAVQEDEQISRLFPRGPDLEEHQTENAI